MDFDLDKLLRRLLERQKEYVCEDLEKYSYAMVAVFTEDGKSYVAFPKFEDADSKFAEYSAIVAKAISQRATMIVTVNDALTVGQDIDTDAHAWGDLDETNARRSILLTASGPGMPNVCLSLGYSINNGCVVFEDEPTYLENVVLNLLPDWPRRDRAASGGFIDESWSLERF